MAVDVCTEISSPRISFSLDFIPVENHNRRSNTLLLNPAVDFDFCIGRGEISSADELFANGRILPVQIKNINSSNPSKEETHHPQLQMNDAVFENQNKKQRKRLVEFLSSSSDAEEEDGKPSFKSFWQFRRSSGGDSENGRGKGLFQLRSLQFLIRSKSTGSVPNPKPSGFPKAIRKQQSLKEGSIVYPSNSTIGSCNQNNGHRNSCNSNNTTSKMPYSKKSNSRSYGGNGVRINPVLNIPPGYIGKGTVSLFGIGSLFCSRKSKKKR